MSRMHVLRKRVLEWKRCKSLVFWCSTGLFVFLIVEAFSWAALSVLRGDITTYEEIRTERYLVINSSGRAKTNHPAADPFLEGRVIHPFIGYAWPPERREQVRVPGEQLDQYGFAPGAGPLIREKNPDQVVIGIFGGSVASLLLPQGGVEAMRQRLAASPAFAGKEIIIDNLGISGFKQPQQLMALNYIFSLGGHFDVIVALDGFNEVALASAELVPQGVFPAYPARWSFHAADIDAEPRMRLLLGEIDFRRQHRAGLARTFGYASHSMTAQFFWKVYDGALSRKLVEREVALQRIEQRALPNFAQQGPLARYPSDEALYDDLVSVWKNSARQMRILAEANNAEFIEILQPNQYADEGKRMSAEERTAAWNEDLAYMRGVQNGYPRLRAAGEELKNEGMTFHDLSRLFHDIERPLYVDACCHMSDEANVMLAEKIAEIIEAKMAK